MVLCQNIYILPYEIKKNMKTRKKETEEKNDYLDLEKEKKKTSRAEELPKSPNKGAVKRK